MAPARMSSRSESVLFPWSIWAMIEKLRICMRPYKGCQVVRRWKRSSLRQGSRPNKSVTDVAGVGILVGDLYGSGSYATHAGPKGRKEAPRANEGERLWHPRRGPAGWAQR